MKPPIIVHVRNTGFSLVATIQGRDVLLTTFREARWRNGLVYLPPPFTVHCSPMPLFEDPADDESAMDYIEGCVLDREVAGWMRDFAAGRLAKGILR